MAAPSEKLGIDAVVFDFDGTMLDTETPYFQAWGEVYAEHGLELTVEEWASCLGTHGGFDPVEDLTTKGAAFDEVELLTRIRARKDELTDVDTLLPGIREWIHEAAELGLAIAVASSSTHDWVNGHLTRLALADRFGHVSCRQEGVPAKPEPDLYLRACDALGVDPRRALAVEDSPNGVIAAKAAGMFCVAVPHELTASLDLAAADLVLPSLAERPLERVIAELTSNRA